MRHNSNADIYGNLKVRGVVVDDLTTQGGFYSQQFGEVAYKSDVGGNVSVKESDDNPPTFVTSTIIFDSQYFYLAPDSTGNIPIVAFRGTTSGGGGAGTIEVAQGPNVYPAVDQLNFNTTYFYLTKDTTTGDPVVNWDLGEGYKEREVILSGDSKNIFWNWNDGNSFFLGLQKNTTLHEPTNYKGGRAQQVNLVTKQPASGFYNITFGRNFIFSGGFADPNTTGEANAIDMFSFHYSPSLRRIIVSPLTGLFY